MGRCIIIMGQRSNPPHTDAQAKRGRSLRFDVKINICIVIHVSLCKVLPDDNCTCVNTLNADFVLKKKKERQMD